MAEIRGDAGPDTLVGTQDADTLIGRAGDDVLSGLNGFDRLVGGPGDDAVSYLPAADEGATSGVRLDLGPDRARDPFGAIDSLFGIERVVGTLSADALSTAGGQSGIREFSGLAGADRIDGRGQHLRVDYALDAAEGGLAGVDVDLSAHVATDGFGDTDTLFGVDAVGGTEFGDRLGGSDSPDIERFMPLAGNDRVTGNGGRDQVAYDQAFARGGTANVRVDLGTGVAVDPFGDYDRLSDVESVRGTRNADRLFGGDSRALEAFQGLDGGDVIDGKAGFDRVDYAHDAAFGGTSEVRVNLGFGTATDGFGNTERVRNVEAVRGSAFADRLSGNDDNTFRMDVLAGLDGPDRLAGGRGIDLVDYADDAAFGGDAGVSVNLDAGRAVDGFGAVDTLVNIEAVRGTNAADVLVGSDAPRELFAGLGGADRVEAGPGFDWLAFEDAAENGGAAGVVVDLDTGRALDPYGERDTFSGIEGVIGTNRVDRIAGSGADDRAADLLAGLGGADRIDGRGGQVVADYSRDVLNGGVGAVSANLGAGQATDGFGDVDTLIGIEGVRGTPSADDLTGGPGDNVLNGLQGGDTLIGGAGRDRVTYADDARFGGEAGVSVDLAAGRATDGFGDTDSLQGIAEVVGTAMADRAVGNANDNLFAMRAGPDTIDGGAGSDTVAYDRSSEGVTVDLGTGTASGGSADGDSLTGIENLTGSPQADRLVGTSGPNRIEGLGGRDELIGGGGVDTVVYAQSEEAVSVSLESGIAAGRGPGREFVSGFENVVGSAFDDALEGTDGENVIVGGAGADRMNGRDGDDTASYAQSPEAVKVRISADRLGQGGHAEGDDINSIENLIGSNGADLLAGNSKNNTFQGGPDGDLLVGGQGSDTASYADSQAGVDIRLAGLSVSGGAARGDTLRSVENLIGSAHADVLAGDSGPNTLRGGDSGDVLVAGSGLDTLSYEGSQAGVTVRLANDQVDGGHAAGDSVSGFENVIGSDAADVLVGTSGDNVLQGGGGGDDLMGGAGRDTVSYAGGATGVTVDLGAGVASGGDASGDDLSDIESLIGSRGDDRLTGDAGSNVIQGGDGDDTLAGAAGADQFRIVRGRGENTIVDWQDGVDVLDVSAFEYRRFANVEDRARDTADGLEIRLGPTLNLDVTIAGLTKTDFDAGDVVI